MNVPEKLQTLRNAMIVQKLDCWLISGSDVHQSEYLPEEDNERKWISGFTGSFGFMAITANNAALWTDSRYYIQAEKQLAGSSITLMKKGLKETPELFEWIINQSNTIQTVGLDGYLFSFEYADNLKNKLAKSGITLITGVKLLQHVWTDRPTRGLTPLLQLNELVTGATVREKINLIRGELNLEQYLYLVTALDEIAWLLNLRGNDIAYNPLFKAFLTISNHAVVLYISPEKTDKNLTLYARENGFIIKPYDDFNSELNLIKPATTIVADIAITSYNHINEPLSKGGTLKYYPSIIRRFKALKNSVEIAGIKKAMITDGVAMVRLIKWCEENIGIKPVTEYDVAKKSEELRQNASNEYMGPSFAPIVSCGENGAIVHYTPTVHGSKIITRDDVLLIDTGGHYLTGTTDITRTIVFDCFPVQAKTDYTLVLKGVIGLSTVCFPEGTRGVQLDIMARQALWHCGIDYGHGTGHGIGHFLNVHEGPQAIRKEDNGIGLQAGMVCSNEPAIYRPGEYGLRIENMIHVVPYKTTAFGHFCKMETLTLCPLEIRLIDKSLLTEYEMKWVNDYHRMVVAQLTPHLTQNEADWIKLKTIEI